MSMLAALAIQAAFSCSVLSVHDGDTFTCAGGQRVRLAAIDAPEVGDCPRWRRCAAGDAQAARRTLDRLARGQRLRCEANGQSYDRVTAFCSTRVGDLSCAMLRAGQAIYLPRYDPGRRITACRRG